LLAQLGAPLLQAIAGRRVFYLANDTNGNAGDRMIDAGTVKFLESNGIEFFRQPFDKGFRLQRVAKCEVALLFGSGSVGWCCSNILRWRASTRMFRLPRILAPSTAMDTGENLSEFESVFARDALSSKMLGAGRRRLHVATMPCLAHWCELPADMPEAIKGVGVFLRDDLACTQRDAKLPANVEAVDPAEIWDTADEYLYGAAQYGAVITDRLHFAIAALLAGRHAVLLPTTWHKTRSYYLSWHLKFPRLHWAWTVREALAIAEHEGDVDA